LLKKRENLGQTTVLRDESEKPGTDHGFCGHLRVEDNADGGSDGSYNADPAARVTFCVFAGEQQQIYLREVFPAPFGQAP